MIFRQWKQVLDGTKTQMRRLRFPYELAVQLWKHGWSLQRPHAPYTWADWQDKINDAHIAEANHILAEQYITLPIKPHRTAKANGRIHAMHVRRERLQEISNTDVVAEGIYLKDNRCGESGWSNNLDDLLHVRPEWAYKALWNSIHKKPGTRWGDDPGVWVLTFEIVDGAC